VRFTLVIPALILLVPVLSAQKPQPAPAEKTTAIAVVPVEAAKAPNPVKSSPESLARAQRWWTMDCAMCHGKEGNGKGETGQAMKLTIGDFTDPATLKDRTDGELFYIIKNGQQDMPPEGQRVKVEENWDLVNYVRSLAKKPAADQKPQP
jgi:mono/diheme cytochrome c family protein